MKFPLNNTKNNGVTAVGIAAHIGNLQILELLANSGGDINFITRHGVGPLYLAIKQSKLECVRYLVDKGAEVHYSEPQSIDNSPIFFAVKMGNAEAVRLLALSKRASLNQISNVEGKSLMEYAESLNMPVICSVLREAITI